MSSFPSGCGLWLRYNCTVSLKVTAAQAARVLERQPGGSVMHRYTLPHTNDATIEFKEG